MASAHVTTGNKRPRSMFLNKDTASYCLVVFLDKHGRKTDDQEVVPMSWVQNGKSPTCAFPNNSVTRRSVDAMIKQCCSPDDSWERFPVKIIVSESTFELASQAFEQNALKAGVESGSKFVQESESESDAGQRKSPKKRKSTTSNRYKRSKKEKEPKDSTIDHQNSFNFDSDAGNSDILNISRNQKNTNKNHRETNLGSASAVRANKLQKSVNNSYVQNSSVIASPDKNNWVSKAVVSSSPSQEDSDQRPTNLEKSTNPSFRRSINFQSMSEQLSTGGLTDSSKIPVSQEEFRLFESKVLYKLNMLIQISNERNQSRTQLFQCPKSITDAVELPASSVQDLVILDRVLEDRALQSELASFLAQLGGRKVSEFLNRALSQLITDELCQYTNWSGSAIKPGTKALDGTDIERPFKKTFSNLLNIVEACSSATKLCIKDATNHEVEEYIKRWLLAYMDRIKPRTHSPRVDNNTLSKSPRKKKGSPKKRRN